MTTKMGKDDPVDKQNDVGFEENSKAGLFKVNFRRMKMLCNAMTVEHEAAIALNSLDYNVRVIKPPQTFNIADRLEVHP